MMSETDFVLHSQFLILFYFCFLFLFLILGYFDDGDVQWMMNADSSSTVYLGEIFSSFFHHFFFLITRRQRDEKSLHIHV